MVASKLASNTDDTEGSQHLGNYLKIGCQHTGFQNLQIGLHNNSQQFIK